MIHRPTTRNEVAILSELPRAIAFVSVEWSVYEIHGRTTFSDFVRAMSERHPEIEVAYWIIHEDWEGIADWFTVFKPTNTVATGY